MFPLPLIAVALAYFLNKNITQKTADAKSISLVPTFIDVKSPKDITLYVEAVNPSQSQFKIDSLSLNVYYNNKVIGIINRPTPFTIKSTQSNEIKLDVTPKAGDALASLITILLQKNSAKSVKIIGAYKFMGLSFPIDKTLSL